MTRVLCLVVVQAVTIAVASPNSEIEQPATARVLGDRPVALKHDEAKCVDVPFGIRDPARISWLQRDRFAPQEVRIESSHGISIWDGELVPLLGDQPPSASDRDQDRPVFGEVGNVVRPSRVPNTQYRPYPYRDDVVEHGATIADGANCTMCGRPHHCPSGKPCKPYTKMNCGCRR